MRPRAAILIAVVTGLLAANVVVTTQAPKAIRDGVATLRQRAAERREAAKPRVLDSDEVKTIFSRHFFGVDEWKTVFGIEVRDAPEPRFTERLGTATCLIGGGERRVSETHRLILIPGDLDLATLEAIFRDRARFPLFPLDVKIEPFLSTRKDIRGLVDRSSKELGTRWIAVPKPGAWLAHEDYVVLGKYYTRRDIQDRFPGYRVADVIETLVSILCAHHFEDSVPELALRCSTQDLIVQYPAIDRNGFYFGEQASGEIAIREDGQGLRGKLGLSIVYPVSSRKSVE
jgi:hypothetical protein